MITGGNFFLIFSLKPYVVTPHLNYLEMVQIRVTTYVVMHNEQKLSLLITKYSHLSKALN